MVSEVDKSRIARWLAPRHTIAEDVQTNILNWWNTNPISNPVGSDPYTNQPIQTTTTGTGTVNNPIPVTTPSPITPAPTPQILPGWPLATSPELIGHVFWQEAIKKEQETPGYMETRNQQIAKALTKAGTMDETGIRAYLTAQWWFTKADQTQQENTVQKILKMIQPATTVPQQQTPFDMALTNASKATGFATIEDMKKQLWTDFQEYASLYPTDWDQNKINAFNTMLQGVILQNKSLMWAKATQGATLEAIQTNYGVGADQVAKDWQTIQNGLDWGLNITQIASTLGKPVSYVTDLLQGKPESLPALSAEQQSKATQYISLWKEQEKVQLENQQRDLKLKMQYLQEDYKVATQQQQEINKINDENMSHLARATGIWFSSSGLEGMAYVHDQWLKALEAITKNFDRNSLEINNQLMDWVDAYNYNIKLYNMKANDAVDSAKTGFFQMMQKVMAQYGGATSEAYKAIQWLGADYMKTVYQINKDTMDYTQKSNEQLIQLNKDAQDNYYKQQQLLQDREYKQQSLTLDQMKLELEKQKAGLPSIYDVAETDWGAIYTPVDTQTVQEGLDTLETNYKDWANGGQCWAFANNYAETLGLGRIFKDPFTQKAQYMNSKEPKVWSFVMRDSGAKLSSGSPAGHVWVVVWVNGDNLLIKDSNGVLGKDWKWTQTVSTRTVSLKKILDQKWWFFDPTIVPTKKDEQEITIDDVTSFNDAVERRKMKSADVNRIWKAKKEIMSDPNADINDIMAWSQWGKAVGETQSKSFIKFDQALAWLDAVQKEIKKMDTWPILWKLRSINPYDTDAQTLKTMLQWLVPTLARWVYGEVWVLTDNDIKLYAKTLPNLSSTEDVNKAVLAYTLDVLAWWYKSQLRSLAGQWYDVSGMEWVYADIKSRADVIRNELGMGEWTDTSWSWDDLDALRNIIK